MGRRIGRSCEVHLHNSEIGDGEFRSVRAVEHIKCSSEDGSEKSKSEKNDNGPEATTAADIAAGAMAAVVIGLRPVNLAAWVVELGFDRARGLAIGCGGGCGSSAVHIGFGRWIDTVCHIGICLDAEKN